MSKMTSPETRFQRYINAARHRETWRIVLVALLVLCAALITITAVGVATGMVRGFTDGLTLFFRGALLVSLLLVLCFLIWIPVSRLRKDQGANLIESASDDFDGRVQTYLDTKERTPEHQFLPLLADDGVQVADRVPLMRIVPWGAMLWPVFFLLCIGVGVLSFIDRAPRSWQNATQHLWMGWKTPGLVQARLIDVLPGDAQILSGENLNITAALTGFSSDEVILHTKTQSGDWITTKLSNDQGGNHELTLFRILQPVEYFVSAAYTESERFTVDVVEPAVLENIQASYSYPEWTQLEPRVDDGANRVSGVKGTQVTLTFDTDRPLNDGFVQLGEQPLTLSNEGNSYTVTFPLASNSQFQLLDRMLDREVPISGELAVILQGDELPEVRFDMPGRDVTASPIEEVLLSVVASDDFAVESLELLYSVNAGEWQTISLPTDSTARYTFELENLGTVLNSAGEVEVDSDQTNPMEPGDLISYYARVRDHNSMAETDIQMIDVRPFDRRFSQGGGGGGGGGGGASANEGSEISKRQKEILIATWNLQRATEAADGDTSAQADNGKLLAELQTTLAEQARTLADRSEARELVEQGEEIRKFVDYLREAATVMEPSSIALEELKFADAVQPQQRALQLLQRAEALFADIRLTQQQQGQGGGGAQPGKDMAEMFELEMDLARNQYEQPDRGQNSSPAEQLDDVFEKLAELAKRQQALEEARRNQQELTREERWRQEQLSRELQELREQLENIDNQNASSEEGDRQQSAQQSRDREAARNAAERLERAQSAMEQSGAQQAENGEEGQTGEGDGEQQDTQQAQRNAAEELQQAVDELAQQRSRDLRAGLDRAVAEATDILSEQRDTESLLRDAIERAVQSRSAGVYSPGLDREQASELAERKRQLQRDLEALKSDIQTLEERFGDQARATGDELEEAVTELDESQATDILGISGDAIESGSLATVLPSESVVTNAIRDFRDRLAEAADLAREESVRPEDNSDIQLASALDQLRDLRQQIEEARRQGQGQEGQGQEGQGQEGQGQEGQGQEGQGQQGQGQQGQGQQGQGQQGQGQQGQGQQGQGQQGQGQQGQGQQGQQGQLAQGSGGASSPTEGSSGQAQGSGRINDQFAGDGTQRGFLREANPAGATDLARALENLVPELEGLGIDQETLADLQISADLFRGAGDNGVNAARIEEEFNRALRNLENLELQISNSFTLESNVIEQLVRNGEISETAAEYFRQLSEQRLRVPR